MAQLGTARAAVFCGLLWAATVASCVAAEVRVGVIGAGAVDFAYGSYLAAKAALLSETGAASLSALGSSRPLQPPGWSAGGFAELELTPRFAVLLSPGYEFFQTGADALDSNGALVDRYGVSFSFLQVPLLIRLRLPDSRGPGAFTLSAGLFGAAVVSQITIIDRYAESTLTALLPAQGSWSGGVTAGAGYDASLGPGVLSIGLRVDVTLISPFAAASSLGGTLYPIDAGICIGYGIAVWRSK